MPITAAAIMAGGSLIGGERANSANAKQARLNRQFQEEMSRTAHQREVADLRAAGLNPILSAKYGGASTPSGSVATMQDTITPALSTAMQGYRAKQELENLRATNANINAQTKKAEAETEFVKNKTDITDVPANILEGVEVVGKRILEEGFDGGADLLRNATPGLEKARNKVTDLIEYVLDGGLQRDLKGAGSSAHQILQNAARSILERANETTATNAKRFQEAAELVRDKIKEENLRNERKSR